MAKRLTLYIVGSIGLCLVAGCASQDLQGEDPVAYYEDHPIKNSVESREESFTAHFLTSQDKLDPESMDKLRSDLHHLSMPAVQSIKISMSKSDSKDADRKLYLIKALHLLGYTRDNITFETSAAQARGDVKLDMTYSIVVPPDCPDWRMSPVTTYSNTSQGNFRCSQEVNTGLMIADPHDLTQGRGDVPVDTVNSSRAIAEFHGEKDPNTTGGPGANVGGGASPDAASAVAAGVSGLTGGGR